MNGRKARLLRKEADRINPFGVPKQLFAPLTFTVQGEEVYYPRVVRRKMMRAFEKGIRTGKINMADVIKRKHENDRAV